MTDESVFAAALAIPSPAARAAYLDRACAGNATLRAEVEALLAAHAVSNPLDRPPADLARTGGYDRGDDPPAPAVGDRVGPYRLMEQIGEGGMGLVFVAEQTEPVRRKVALKVIKPGMDTRQVVARFEAERQALALMDHPHIARVLDAGATPEGRPYFVMELVRGLPITDYCDQQKLPPRERLALFVQVCQAVQHAHQKGVIHRDIKPSNVLVAPHDGVPVVKVIDFGVAKAVGQSLTDKTIYTRFAQLIGTPLYMSPEQAEVNQLDVDTRADVYALGVLLYELLTGTTPFDGDRFRKAAFDEIRRILREEDPPKPSTRLTSLGDTLTVVSARRGTDPGRLAGLVRGELDWIVMRCLEKDRNRRYDSAAGLAKDVQRHLTGELVEARPPTLGYRVRKFYHRNRAAILVALLFVVTLKGTTLFSIWQVSRAFVAEAFAEQQRDAAFASARVAEENESRADRNSAEAKRNAELVATEAAKVRAEQALTRRLLYASHLSTASVALADDRVPRVLEMLDETRPKPGEPDLRGWEWHYLDRLTRTGREYTLPEAEAPEAVPARPGQWVQGRWLIRLRRTADGLVYDIHDATDGRKLAQVPKAGAIDDRQAGGKGFPFPNLSDDGRHLLLRRDSANPLFPDHPPTPSQLWDVEAGTAVDGPTFARFGGAMLPGVVVGPGGEWMAWLERAAGSNPPQRVSPVDGLAAPLRVAVGRWDRATGATSSTPLTIGTAGTGFPLIGADGRSVFWLPVSAVVPAVTAKGGTGGGFGGKSGGFAFGSRPEWFADQKLTCECWEATRKPARRWAVEFTIPPAAGFAGRSPAVAFSPGRTAVAFRNRGEVAVHRTADGKHQWTAPLAAGDRMMFSVADDGNRVVQHAAGTITVATRTDAPRPDVWRLRYRPRDAADGSTAEREQFYLMPDGRTLVGSARSAFRAWDVSHDPAGIPAGDRLTLRTLTDSAGVPWTERTTSDGRVAVKFQRATLQRAAAGPVVVTTTGAGSVELPGGSHPTRAPSTTFLDRDRRLLVRVFQTAPDEPPPERLTKRYGEEWTLYDIEGPGAPRRLAGGVGHPYPVANSPYLLNHGVSQYAWTTDRFEVLDARSGAVVQGFAAPPAERYYVADRMFDPTGGRFVRFASPTTGDADAPVRVRLDVIETASGQSLWSADLGELRARGAAHARFTPDGKQVLCELTTPTGTYLRAWPVGGGPGRTIDLGRPPAPWAALGGPSSILDVTDDGRLVAVRDVRAVSVWDVTTGERVRQLTVEDGSGRDAAFSADGTRLFTREQPRFGGERRVRVWDLATGRELLTIPTGTNSPAATGSFREDGGRIIQSLPNHILDGRPVAE